MTDRDDAVSAAPLAVRSHHIHMGEVDMAGTVYFSRPYEWHEGLMVEWLTAAGRPLSGIVGSGHALVVVSSESSYAAPTGLDDVLRLELDCDHMGRSSFRLRMRALREGSDELCLQTRTTHIWAEVRGSTSDGGLRVSAVPLPDWLRDALAADAPAP